MIVETNYEDYQRMVQFLKSSTDYSIKDEDYDVLMKWIQLYKRGFVYNGGCAEFFSGYEDGEVFCLLQVYWEDENNIHFFIGDTRTTIKGIRYNSEFFKKCITNSDVNHCVCGVCADKEEVEDVLKFFNGDNSVFPCTACGFINSGLIMDNYNAIIPSVVAFKILNENGIADVLTDAC